MNRLWAQIALLAGVVVVVAAIAEAAGAANLGVALGIAQVAFAVVLIWLLARA